MKRLEEIFNAKSTTPAVLEPSLASKGFLNREVVSDHFYFGQEWSVGLKRFLNQAGKNEMVFYFRPLYKDAPFLDDLNSSGIQISDKIDQGFELNRVDLRPEYCVPLSF